MSAKRQAAWRAWGLARRRSPCCCRSSSAQLPRRPVHQALALAVAVLGLNLLVGYSGQISLGHGAFFALGAYTSAISIDRSASRTWRPCRSPASSRAAGPGRPARPAAARALPGAGHARPGDRDAADHQARRGLTGGTQGLSVGSRVPRVVRAGRRPVAVLRHAGGHRGDVPARRVPRARARRARARGDPRQRDRGATMGVDLARYKTRDVRDERGVRRCGRARCSRCRSASSPRSRSRSRCRSPSWRRSWSAAWPPSPGALFGALFIEFVPVYAADVNEALAGRDLRRRADPVHVPRSRRGHGAVRGWRDAWPPERKRVRRKRREDRGGLTIGEAGGGSPLAGRAAGGSRWSRARAGAASDEQRRRRRRRRADPGITDTRSSSAAAIRSAARRPRTARSPTARRRYFDVRQRRRAASTGARSTS